MSLKYFSILRPMKNDVRFEHVTWKRSDFVSFTLFGLPSTVIKLRSFDFENHWNTLIFFHIKYIMSDLNMSHGKLSDFVSLPLFGFILVIKLRNFDFVSHWNTLIFFDKKHMASNFIDHKLHYWIQFFQMLLTTLLTA